MAQYLSVVEYKKNFLKIKQLVLIGGPDDGVITPWQSRYNSLTVAHYVIAMQYFWILQ